MYMWLCVLVYPRESQVWGLVCSDWEQEYLQTFLKGATLIAQESYLFLKISFAISKLHVMFTSSGSYFQFTD